MKSAKRGGYALDHASYLSGLHVFCDGACIPNPGPGGWGFAVYEDGAEIFAAHGGAADSTNNQMEMTGALEAIRWISKNAADRAAQLHCDSQYVVKGCNTWRHNWKRRGWTLGKSAPVKNLDLWKELDEALQAFPLALSWVKGHAGVTGNERADALSLVGMEAFASTKQEDTLTADYRRTMRDSI